MLFALVPLCTYTAYNLGRFLDQDVLAMSEEQQLDLALHMSLATPAPPGEREGRDAGMDVSSSVGVNEVPSDVDVCETASTVRNTDSSSVITQVY